MLFVTFDIYGAERAHRAEVFAGSAAYAALGVDHRNVRRIGIVRVQMHHTYGSHRAMACAVAAFHALADRKAEVPEPYRVPHLNRALLLYRYAADRAGRAYL